jgi:hypothetical protein
VRRDPAHRPRPRGAARGGRTRAADGRHGASNPEIAQELYVTLKTVETHLYNTYTKLGLSGRGSRKRLALAVARPEQAIG